MTEYYILINQTAASAMTTAFRLAIDFSTEGYANEWEALGATLAASIQPGDGVINIAHMGTSASGWPTLLVTFASRECAKAFMFAYLGGDENTPEVYAEEIEQQAEDLLAYGDYSSN